MKSKGAVYLLMLCVGAAHRSLLHILLGSKVSIAIFFLRRQVWLVLSSALFNLSFNKNTNETTHLRRDDSDSELQGLADHQTPATLVLVDNSFTNVCFFFLSKPNCHCY